MISFENIMLDMLTEKLILKEKKSKQIFFFRFNDNVKKFIKTYTFFYL